MNSQFQRVIAYHDNAQRHIERLGRMTDVEIAALSPDSVNVYADAMINNRTFDAQDGNVDAALASGSLRILQSAELRTAVVEWKANVDDLAEETSELRATAGSVLDRTAAMGGPWSPGAGAGGLQGIPTVAAGVASLPTARLSEAVRDADLMSRVRTKRFRTLIYLAQLIPLAEEAESVLTLVQASLGQP